nr:hypothetical protein [Tanacetum cinerariifolium]
MTIDQQVALDEDLVPDASRLRIRKSNFRLRSNITSKESTLQLATAIVHHHSIRFKMDNMKRIIDLEYFREMMHICPRLVGQTFDDLSFEEEILDFVYQVEHKDAKKRNEMYYPRFIKVIIYYFMTKDPSIPRRNVVNWHYVRDDKMFTTIKLVSRHQNTQQFGVMLPIELTNENIRNSEAYKEYYVVASGAAPPKTKASVRKTKSSYDTIITPPTAAGTKLSTSVKGKQLAKASKAKNDAQEIPNEFYERAHFLLRVVDDAQEIPNEFYERAHFLLRVTTSTPMEPNKALIKDAEAKDVDVHLYKLMIGSLMYLTAFRPDIMFAVCACTSDYAGASLDRKSTTGGCQFLGKRLISWQCKKQTIVANSTTEAEYVAPAN